MNPILVVPRPRVPSGNGGRYLQSAVRPIADSGMLFVPAQRAVEPVSSMRAVLAAKNDARLSSRVHSRPLPRPPTIFYHPQTVVPQSESMFEDEDALPPPPVFVAMPELRHPRPQRVINRAQMAADAFEHFEAQVQETAPTPAPGSIGPPPHPIPRRLLNVHTPSQAAPPMTNSAPPYPIPRRRLDLADSHRRAATVVAPEVNPAPRQARPLPRRPDEYLTEVPVRRRS